MLRELKIERHDDLCEEYWELCPFDEAEMITLKRKIMHFNDDKEYSISELWVGFPSKYKMIPIALKKVQELGKKLYALLPESYKNKYEDEDDFIFRWLCFDRMMKHVKENKKFFEIHKMTDEQIQKALFDHERDLIDKFHKDDPDIEKTPEKIKAALALARAKQEL